MEEKTIKSQFCTRALTPYLASFSQGGSTGVRILGQVLGLDPLTCGEDAICQSNYLCSQRVYQCQCWQLKGNEVSRCCHLPRWPLFMQDFCNLIIKPGSPKPWPSPCLASMLSWPPGPPFLICTCLNLSRSSKPSFNSTPILTCLKQWLTVLVTLIGNDPINFLLVLFLLSCPLKIIHISNLFV